MSHTNSTTNYSLPQFVTTDKPAWLTDINGAMSAIDTAIKNAADAAGTAGTDAAQALIDAGNASTAASGADAKASGAISSIGNGFSTSSTYAVDDKVIYNNLLYKCIAAVTTPGAWTGSLNWSRINTADIIPDTSEELPFDTSDPSVSVADMVGAVDTKASTASVGISVTAGYTLVGYCNARNNKLIALNFMVEKSSGAWSSGWQVVGSVEYGPTGGAVFAPLWNISQGAPIGMCRIDTDGTINFYVTTGSSVRTNVNITYKMS